MNDIYQNYLYPKHLLNNVYRPKPVISVGDILSPTHYLPDLSVV